MSKSFAVSFSDQQAAKIKEHAAALGRSSSFVVRQALDQYFAQFERQTIQGSNKVNLPPLSKSDVQVF